MPSVAVKLYSVFFKFLVKHRLQSRFQNMLDDSNAQTDPFGVTSRPEESISASNPVFTDGVATKDIHVDALTSLSLRIFLPETVLSSDHELKPNKSKIRGTNRRLDAVVDSGSDLHHNPNANSHRRNSFGPSGTGNLGIDRINAEQVRRNSYGCVNDSESGVYMGYLPAFENKRENFRKLPMMLQFHGGGFVSGGNDSVANDFFCRRIAKLCDVIVLAVGYRLAPENRYPAAFEDGWKVLNWLAKQANLAECTKSLVGNVRGGVGTGVESKKSDVLRHMVVDTLGATMVEPWLAAHGDPSRCVLLGVSCGANIADYVARKAVEAGKLLDPVKVVAQVLMYPFFIGSVPTQSEIKLANSYFYDKAMCILAWKLFLPEDEYSLDHPAANPLVPDRGPPLKLMPPTLIVVAEHDWMRDRAIAYSEELRKVNVDAPVLEYKDAVHEFATLDMLLKTPQAQACAEDIAIWVKKYISIRGHEFSY
ncbi:Probable carboxylesterase 11 [Ancistrocladus abbreviatus]